MGHPGMKFSLRPRAIALWAIAQVIGAAMLVFASDSDAGLTLGCVGLLPLFFAIRFLRPRHALAAGLVWGSSVWVFTGVAAETVALGSFTSLILL